MPSLAPLSETSLLSRYVLRDSVHVFTQPNGDRNQSNLGYSETIAANITTLSTTDVPTTKGTIQGLLYVPDLASDDACFDLANTYIPANATRQSDLPLTDYILIALVPWINSNCTKSFMAAAALDPLHAMLVYRPDDEDGQPPESDSDLWKIDSGRGWKQSSHFPVYAVASGTGDRMMQQLKLYSGDLSEVPFADEINKTYNPDPADYVRVWTQLSVSPDPSLLAIWALVLIILAVIVTVIGGTSLLMHYVQNRRRASRTPRPYSNLSLVHLQLYCADVFTAEFTKISEITQKDLL